MNYFLLKAFKENISSFSDNVFILDHIPEQAEDIYVLLIDGMRIIEIELLRSKNLDFINLEEHSVYAYLKTRPYVSKFFRRKLAAALDICKTLSQQNKISDW